VGGGGVVVVVPGSVAGVCGLHTFLGWRLPRGRGFWLCELWCVSCVLHLGKRHCFFT
jgi:hypothetical protein